MPAVELILPVYDEREQVPRVFAAVLAWAAERPEALIRFVDDGSRDGTADALEQALAAAREGAATREAAARVRVERNAVNAGKGSVIRRAMVAAQAPIACFTDGDLAYSLDHVDRLVEALRGADVAIGSRALGGRAERNISLKRRAMGAAFNLAVRVLLGLPNRDTQAGIKGFRREAAHAIFGLSKVDDFAFDVEILYLARVLGLRVTEVPAQVSAAHSYHGTSMDLLRDPLRMLRSVLRVRRLHRRLPRPAAAGAP